MRIIKFFLRVFLVLLVLFAVAATIYVRIYGKSLLEGVLNTSLKRNVVLGSVSYQFPFGLQARDVRIAQSDEGGEFLTVQRILAQMAPDEVLFRGRLAFDTVVLVEPSLVIKGRKDSSETAVKPVTNDQNAAAANEPEPSREQTEIKSAQILVDRLVVRQGRVRYNEGLTEKGYSFTLEELDLDARSLAFPLRPGQSSFDLTGKLVKKGNPLSGSLVKSEGWVDVVKKDMETNVQVIEKDGSVGMTARAVSTNNDMEVTGEVKMHNLLVGTDEKAASDASAINDLVLNALSTSGIEIGAQFAFKTQMDNFRVGQVSFTGNVITK